MFATSRDEVIPREKATMMAQTVILTIFYTVYQRAKFFVDLDCSFHDSVWYITEYRSDMK
jgi:hypothetical protein